MSNPRACPLCEARGAELRGISAYRGTETRTYTCVECRSSWEVVSQGGESWLGLVTASDRGEKARRRQRKPAPKPKRGAGITVKGAA